MDNLKDMKKHLAFLDKRRPKNTFFEIRCINNDNQSKQFFFENKDDLIEWAKRDKKLFKGYNIYVGVNPRIKKSGKKDAVYHMGFLWADLDGNTSRKDWKKIKEMLTDNNLTPNLIVASSDNKIQIYWKLFEAVDTHTGERLQKAMTNYLKREFEEYGPDNVNDCSRLLRLAGTYNIKYGEPQSVKVLNQTDIVHLAETLENNILKEFIPKSGEKERKEYVEISPGEMFKQLLLKDEKLNNLWTGKIPDNYKSRSEMELALLNKLVFYGFSDEQINWVMSRAKTQKNKNEPKWNESTEAYRIHQLNTAKRDTSEFVSKKNKEEERGGKEEENKEIVLVSAKELKTMDKPKLEWLIEDIIPAKKYGMVKARKANYKSLFCLRMALSIATGTDFCGKQAKKGKVIYFDEEVGDTELDNRIERICNAMDIERPENLKCFFTRLNEHTPKLDKKEDWERIDRLIKKEKPVLVIFDLMRRFHGIQENSADEVQWFYRERLKPLFEKNGITIIGVFHDRKRSTEFKKLGPFEVDVLDMLEENRSSSEWVNISSFVIMPTRFDSKSLFCGLYAYRRNAMPLAEYYRVQFTKDNIFFTKAERDEIERTQLISENEKIQEVMEWIRSEGITEFKTGELKELFDFKLNNNEINRLLGKMVNKDIIKKIGRGRYIVTNVTNSVINDF